jgi:arylformamidase
VLVEISHRVEDGRGAYPGFPPPRIGAILDHDASRDRYDGQAEFYLGRVEMAGNTGTYLDAPFHRHRDREDLASIPLERLVALSGLLVDAADTAGAIALDLPDGSLAGRALLVRTGRSRAFGTDAYWTDAPFLDGPAAERLVRGGLAMLGVDFGNVDDTTDPVRPAHTTVLGAGIPIVENLTNLDRLPTEGFRVTAVPPPLVGGASFPVRAFAEVDEPGDATASRGA